MSGLFVTVDGPCGIGKTTVSLLLRDKLVARGIWAVLTTTPSRSRIGELARHGTYDFHGEALTCLVAADRYHHERVIVRPSVEQGAVVVCDRYVPGALVLDPLDGVEPDFVRDVYRRIAVPDIAFVLLGDPAVCAARAAARGRYSRFHATDDEDSRRELAMFKEAAVFLRATGYPARDHNIGSASAGEVAEELVSAIMHEGDGGV